MKAELSQPTLGVVRHALDEMSEDILDRSELPAFWKDTLFDFCFAPAVIDVLATYDFKWGDIIRDAFVGKLGHQNSYFSNALSPSFCEQTLKRLAALALFHSKGRAIGDRLRESLREDGFDIKAGSNGDFSAPKEVQQKLSSPLSKQEMEIINVVLDRFLNLNDSTPRKPLNIKSGSPEILERLVRCCILKTNDQGLHFLPLSLAFHYSGNAAALDRAKRSITIVLSILRDLYLAFPDNPESQFTFDEIESHARKMHGDTLDVGLLKLGLYLAQELSSTLAGYGCNTQGTNIAFVRIHENIVHRDIDGAWDAHIEHRSQYIEREEFEKRIARSQQARKESMPQPSTPTILVLISHSSKDEKLAAALIDVLRAGLGLLATQIRCSSVDGYRLPAGVNSDDQLRAEIADAGVLVGLLTANSLSSTYVLFELGARWGIQRFMIPLFAGVSPEDMRGPQRVLNGLSCRSESQLIQFIEDAGRQLGITPQSSSSYLDKVRAVKTLAETIKTQMPQSSTSDMVYEESVYWKKSNGTREGPYCPVCYDDKQKAIHLNPGATRGTAAGSTGPAPRRPRRRRPCRTGTPSA